MYKLGNYILLLQAIACARAEKAVTRITGNSSDASIYIAFTAPFISLTEHSHFWNSEHTTPVLSDQKFRKFFS